VSKQPGITSRLRDDIISGALPFGSRLTIDQLSRRYATSHMPVREALRQLAGEGIIDSEPHRGARVRSIDTSYVTELLDLRAGIEALLARQAALVATSADVQQLEIIESRYERCAQADDHESALIANSEFHRYIYSLSGTSDALGLVNRHWVVLAALWKRYGYPRERFSGVINDHQQIIHALFENDGKAAEMIMGAHVIKSRQYLVQQMLNAGHQSSAEATITTIRAAI
jgi:DNA-binding GntR family transcriptional regulator